MEDDEVQAVYAAESASSRKRGRHHNHDHNNNVKKIINPWEDKESLANGVTNIRGNDGSKKGLHLRIKLKGIIDNNYDDHHYNNKKKKEKIKHLHPGHTRRMQTLSTNNCCYLCRKSFPTVKSLCGHMRSHPEREWRGIQPPLRLHVASNSNSTSSSNHSAVVDLSRSLPRWSATAKRGRKTLSSTSSRHNINLRRVVGVEEVEEHHMEEGVYELMFLAGVDTSNMKKNKLAGDSSTESYSLKSLKPWSYDQEEEEQEEDFDFQNSDHGSTVGIIDIEKENKSANKKKKGTKKMKLNEIGTTTEQGKTGKANRYRCSICNESFQSYQSLGGHLSNHKMESNNIQSIDEFESHDEQDHHHANHATMQVDDETKTLAEEDAVGSCGSNTVEIMGRKHFNICNNTFSTGEALGLEDHNISRSEAQSSQATSIVKKSQNRPKILSFDLNLPPAMDEEEEGTQSDLLEYIPTNIVVQSSYYAPNLSY
ncbi:hypothetical protein RIF29_33227 [Crotalaria pallida]|uniref:C2H2-type domain-containing protein n=1 Tax=Crotalaria pallida TaxID=3830 RepID=A0AAN9E7J7_CROPI